MSEPVANVDIEDVLSSIRRLVSGGPDKDGRASEEARAGERLVLTPSQRVDAADDAAAVGTTRAHPPEIETARETDATTDPDADAATDTGTGTDTGSDTDTDAGDDVDIAALLRETDTAAPDLPGTQSGMHDDPASDPGEGRAGTTPEIAPEMAAPDTAAETAAETGAPVPDEPDDADQDALDGIAAMFARHETATPSAWEPDGDDEDAFGEGAEAPALAWRDFDAADDRPEPDTFGTQDRGAGVRPARDQGSGSDAGPRIQQDAALALEDEAVLDEEALRDLVAEIVREELMGTLGERITRNVRKLVRREIHRALNSQEFD
jgi:hypothetical protein